jgi:ribose 5-phosphate isomerase A
VNASQQRDEFKRVAAERATEYVTDGMVVGLGTGSTAQHAARALAARVAAGLNIVGVPTSERTARMARELGIPLTTLEEHPQIDVTIDGADEVDLSTFYAIKGLGGALLREKIVALATRLEIIIVDDSKVASRLGEREPLPVEVAAFGWSRTRDALAALGCEPQLRASPDGSPYVTDSGNYLLDCQFPAIDEPPALASRVKALTGVVEHGLFLGIIDRVVIAGAEGIRVVDK